MPEQLLRVLELTPSGDRLVLEDFQLSIILEAIKIQDNVPLLCDEYEGMLEPDDSLSALLARLHNAGLVRLNGDQVQLTTAGKRLVHTSEHLQENHTRVIPSWTVDVSKYYLWIEGVDLQGSHFFDTSLRSHIQVLRACLHEFATALDTDQHDEICNYLDFIHQAHRVQDSEDPKLVVKENPSKLLEALRALVSIEDLVGRYNLPLFSDYYALGCDFQTGHVRKLVRFLEAHQDAEKLTFWIMWGR